VAWRMRRWRPMPDDRCHYGAEYLRARAVNAEPWEPMQGMVKALCAE
jgi:hypothetical protein